MSKGFKKFLVTVIAFTAGLAGFVAFKKYQDDQTTDDDFDEADADDGTTFSEDLFDHDGSSGKRNYVTIPKQTYEDYSCSKHYPEEDKSSTIGEAGIDFDAIAKELAEGSLPETNEDDAASEILSDTVEAGFDDEFLTAELEDDINK